MARDPRSGANVDHGDLAGEMEPDAPRGLSRHHRRLGARLPCEIKIRGRPPNVEAQANTVGFTQVGNDFVFQPASGNVSIKAPMNLKIEGAGSVDLRAGATLQQRGAMILIN